MRRGGRCGRPTHAAAAAAAATGCDAPDERRLLLRLGRQELQLLVEGLALARQHPDLLHTGRHDLHLRNRRRQRVSEQRQHLVVLHGPVLQVPHLAVEGSNLHDPLFKALDLLHRGRPLPQILHLLGQCDVATLEGLELLQGDAIALQLQNLLSDGHIAPLKNLDLFVRGCRSRATRPAKLLELNLELFDCDTFALPSRELLCQPGNSHF
mmetsp:Transcript_178854/g.567549  ORF Transcript_178854/g.567549 Transcript_178854/m.567549 type:complete len:210 (+) Transcript_178854:478-1107(+)